MAQTAWDGTDRRQRPEWREDDERIFEARVRLLEAQVADMAVVMRDAVAQGVSQALTDPVVHDAVWNTILTRAKSGAAERTGRWFLGSLGALLNRWVVIGALVMLVGQYIGWPAALKVLFGAIKGAA